MTDFLLKEGNDFFELEKKKFIQPYTIDNKNKYISAIWNIEHSFTGRMDVPYANTFIYESTQLLINSIELFELGYFDAAYYSLRQAIEVSTVMIFFSDLSSEEKENFINDWKGLKKFPMQNQMVEYISHNGLIFQDIKEKLSDYFDFIKNVSATINKVVHKQGYKFFYTSRNHPISENKYDKDKFKEDYVSKLKDCIGIVAVMRLVIDPYPILLTDYEIYSRSMDSMTEQYSEKFIKEYIGTNIIDKYKECDIYVNHYNGIISEEKKNSTILNIVKHQCIDTSNKNEIIEQVHLLDEWDYYASMLAINFDKVCKVYCCGGLQMYFTDRNTNRKKHSWGGKEFDDFSKSLDKYNQNYDEVYISVITLNTKDYYIEHNKRLNKKETEILKDFEKRCEQKREY